MKIVIVGAGKIGSSIIKHVSSEAHEVTVIDVDSSVIEDIVNQYDVMGLCGNGVSYDIQRQAGVEDADLFLAVSEGDEANMLACLIARKLGAKHTIARVRDIEYTNQVKMLTSALEIDKTVNPELEVAYEISRILNFPGALKVDNFASGNSDLVEFMIPENSPLAGMKLMQIKSKFQVQVLVCAVLRGDDVIIPTGTFVFEEKDRIFISSDRSNSKAFMDKLGLTDTRLKNVLIIGGGRIAYYLSEQLIKNKYSVKIIEQDKAICEELSEKLPNVTVIHGDGTDQNLLREEGIGVSDALICLTNSDEQNIIISMYANKQHMKKIVTKVSKKSFGDLLESVEIASVISPQEVTAVQVVSYLRALNNSTGNNIKTLYKIVEDKLEALEFNASNKSKTLGIELKDLKIKSGCIIAGIIHEGKITIPNGLSKIMENDSVIIVTSNKGLDDLDDILV